MFTRRLPHRLTRAFALSAPLAAILFACSAGDDESTASSASPILSCPSGYVAQCTEACGPPDCARPIPPKCTCVLGAPTPPPSPPSTCTATAPSSAAIAFTSADGMLSLKGTSAATAAGATTTTYAITSGSTPVLTITTSTSGFTSRTEVDYGAPFHGLTQAVFTSDGKTNGGSVNGRALVPQAVGHPAPVAFADGQPAPAVTVDPGTQQSVYALLDHARGDFSSMCPGTSGGAHAPGDAGTQAPSVTSLVAALEHSPAGTPSSAAKVARAGASAPRATSAVGSGAIAAPPIEYATYQNTPDDDETPDCTSCWKSCAENPLDWLSGGFGWSVCIGVCFAPGNGCGESICREFGHSCDNGDACCGNGGGANNGGCCPSGSVCGSYDLGTCCPANAPVACGDMTGQGCFPAGSSCCGGGSSTVATSGAGAMACGPGQACVNTTPGDPKGTIIWGCCPAGQSFASGACCPNDQVYGSGLCCSVPTCGGVCCAGGTCVNDQCVMPNLGGGGPSGGVCTAGPLTPVALSDTTVPESTWIGNWADEVTGTVQVTIGFDAKSGFDVQAIESQVACGTGALEPAIIATQAGAQENAAFVDPWNGTLPTACVSNPPAPPTPEKLTVLAAKSLNPGNDYLTLYTFQCQGAGPTTPQYAIRYTRIGGSAAVYSDYMLYRKAPLK
jgi:hypothetical protein